MMNKKQIIALWLGIVAAALILLFPVKYNYDSGMREVLDGRPGEERWIVPERKWYAPVFFLWVDNSGEYRKAVTVPLAVTVLVTAGLLATLATRNRRD